MGLQTPSAPWVLSLAPPLGTLCSVQCLAVSIHLCICQALAGLSGDRYNRLLSASTCWHPQKCLGLVIVYGMDPQVGQSLNGHSFNLCSKLCLCNFFRVYFVPSSFFFFKFFFPFFIRYFLHLHFKCYPKSPPRPSSPTPLPTHSHFLALAFPRTEAYKVHKTKGPPFPMMAN